MDRNRKKKINLYCILSLLFLIVCGTGFLGIARSEHEKQLLWMIELAAKHPELEAEGVKLLKGTDETSVNEGKAEAFERRYGYSFYQTAQGRSLFLQTGVVAIAGLAAIWSSYLLSEKKKEQREEEEYALEERVKEQAAYIQDLKESAKMEEENTKALITNISHQLKTPLASLKMMWELCEDGEISEEELKDYFQRSGESVERLTQLTEELMQLSKLENHMICLKPEANSVKETIVSAVEEMIMKAIHKKIEIQMDVQEEVMCRYDSKWTREAFVNVLDNGVKYSEPGTKITIRLQKMHTYGLIEVEDEGIGMKQEEYHKIFGRFYRGAVSEVQNQEGAGVGLYLTRKIIENQGGTVSVKSSPGEGSTFRMTLPLA